MAQANLAPLNENAVLGRINRGIDTFVKWVMYVGAGLLFLWTLYTFLDVLLRYFFNSPLGYNVDYTQLALAGLVSLSIPYAQLVKGHVRLDLITERLKPNTQLALATFWYVINTAVIGIVAWQNIRYAMEVHQRNTQTFGGISFFPGAVAIAFGFTLLFIVLTRDLIRSWGDCSKANFGIGKWIAVTIVPIALIFLYYLLTTQTIEPFAASTMGYLTIIILFLGLFLGQTLFSSLLLCTILLMGYSSGWASAMLAVGSTLFSYCTDYNFSVVPLYILMSYFIMLGGLGEKAFWGAAKWVGHLRGGLAYATITGSTALAACVGSGTAATVTMGLIAYPEMRKYKYDDALSTGCIAAGATLGPIIPPSLPMIIFGLLTETSIGKLFIAGIIPGILLAFLFCSWIFLYVRVNKQAGPATEKSSWKERVNTLPSFGPIMALFLLVVGGLYLGIFTAIEGGAIGAIGALVIAIALRQFTVKKFGSALGEAIKFLGMIYLMIAGGLALTHSFGVSGLSHALAAWIESLGVSGFVIVLILLIVYVLWGIVGDAGIIVILTVPIMFPVLEAMGVNAIWFGLVTLIFGGMGVITPPFAIGIFMLRAVACPELPVRTMFMGVIPFCIATAIGGLICVFFPQLATWLPTVMS